MSYGLVAWGHAAKTHLQKLLVLQKRVCRLMYFSEPRAHAVSLFITSNILPTNMLYVDTIFFKVEWYPIYGPKSLFTFGEKGPIVCYCTREKKINFEGFTQNGCSGNQPQPFEVVFYSIDANTSCSFTKQDLTVKQAYRASFCFVLCNKPKFWQLR